jgi:chorismate mutase
MKQSDFLVVKKDVLPSFYVKVLRAVEMVNDENKSVSDVCKELDISRSTFYKYKDKVFEFRSEKGKKAIITLKTENQKGVLSNVLNLIAFYQGNILTITQEMPIRNIAFITITLDVIDLSITVHELVYNLKSIQKVKDVALVAFE